jgi:amidase
LRTSAFTKQFHLDCYIRSACILTKMADTYKKIAAEKQAEAFKKIPEEWRLSEYIMQKISSTSDTNVMSIPSSCGILSSTEIKITEDYTATALAREIASGVFTAVQVTRAFCKRAAISQQLVCVSQQVYLYIH